MNLEESQKQVAEQQATIEKINSTRRRFADAETKLAEAQRDVDDAASKLRQLETENPPLHVLNARANQSPPSSDGVEIDGQSAAAVNVNASADARPGPRS